jgi:hypothetical protein
MSWEAITVLVGVGGLLLQTIALIAAGIWRLSRTEAAIRQEIASHRIENADRVDTAVRQIGETFTAFRTKITEVELYLRDNYVRRDSFQSVVGQVMGDMKTIGDRIEARLLRMEGKIDRNSNSSD